MIATSTLSGSAACGWSGCWSFPQVGRRRPWRCARPSLRRQAGVDGHEVGTSGGRARNGTCAWGGTALRCAQMRIAPTSQLLPWQGPVRGGVALEALDVGKAVRDRVVDVRGPLTSRRRRRSPSRSANAASRDLAEARAACRHRARSEQPGNAGASSCRSPPGSPAVETVALGRRRWPARAGPGGSAIATASQRMGCRPGARPSPDCQARLGTPLTRTIRSRAAERSGGALLLIAVADHASFLPTLRSVPEGRGRRRAGRSTPGNGRGCDTPRWRRITRPATDRQDAVAWRTAGAHFPGPGVVGVEAHDSASSSNPACPQRAPVGPEEQSALRSAPRSDQQAPPQRRHAQRRDRRGRRRRSQLTTRSLAANGTGTQAGSSPTGQPPRYFERDRPSSRELSKGDGGRVRRQRKIRGAEQGPSPPERPVLPLAGILLAP